MKTGKALQLINRGGVPKKERKLLAQGIMSHHVDLVLAAQPGQRISLQIGTAMQTITTTVPSFLIIGGDLLTALNFRGPFVAV